MIKEGTSILDMDKAFPKREEMIDGKIIYYVDEIQKVGYGKYRIYFQATIPIRIWEISLAIRARLESVGLNPYSVIIRKEVAMADGAKPKCLPQIN